MPQRRLRSRAYLERYLNYGLSLEELRSGRPIIGIAQSQGPPRDNP